MAGWDGSRWEVGGGQRRRMGGLVKSLQLPNHQAGEQEACMLACASAADRRSCTDGLAVAGTTLRTRSSAAASRSRAIETAARRRRAVTGK